jgi:hypothetical protein
MVDFRRMDFHICFCCTSAMVKADRCGVDSENGHSGGQSRKTRRISRVSSLISLEAGLEVRSV